jgi:hypothetical protein
MRFLSDAQRLNLLHQLFDAMLEHLHRVMTTSKEPIKASMFDVVRHFLNDQGISATSRAEAARGVMALKQQIDNLPFDPTEEK